MRPDYWLGIALAVFLVNWLFIPLLFRSRTHTDGFFIGLIVAVIAIVFGPLVT